MKESTKIVAAALGGYALGRRRKFKLAIALGLYVAGKQLDLNPQKIAGLVMSRIGDSPQLAELREQAQGELASVGKAAAGAIIDRQAGNLADALQSRTARISGEVAEDDEAEDQTEDGTEDQTQDEETSGSRSKSGSTGKRRAPARRSGAGTSRRRRTTAGSES